MTPEDFHRLMCHHVQEEEVVRLTQAILSAIGGSRPCDWMAAMAYAMAWQSQNLPGSAVDANAMFATIKNDAVTLRSYMEEDGWAP